jgi:hypothetical protein
MPRKIGLTTLRLSSTSHVISAAALASPSVASTLVTRREQFHQTRIVEHLIPLDPTFSTFTSQLSHAATVTMNGLALLGSVFKAATAQILVLSYIDAFKFFAVVFFLLLTLLLFVKPRAASGGGGEARRGEKASCIAMRRTARLVQLR